MHSKDVLKEAIRRHGRILQTFVAIEEMAELQKELSKDMRGENNHEAILEEMADVCIMIEELKIIHDISTRELSQMKRKKIDRLKKKLEEEK